MDHSILLKGNKYGIVVVLDESMDFGKLLEKVGEKFKESEKFFDTKSKLAISFEGRTLSNNEIKSLLDWKEIAEELQKETKAPETTIPEEVTNQEHPNNGLTGMFYKGTLRSGQSIESATSLIILGDVNLGAEVQAAGNIVILGCLKGTAFAGCHGNINAFVMALNMEPMQIRIANYIARSSDQDRNKKTKEPKEAKIAFVENENIYIEPVSKDVLNDISI